MSDSEARQALPDIDFATFLLSLGSSALIHLGEMADPGTGKPEINLPLAKQTIDIIAMLERKTDGNRDEAEDKLIMSLLYDLRIKFIDSQKSQAKK
ncbi:MAG: DUF1844 domain-containing protein [Deltaproteobacteria bacterium]|nr:DUF1844 domain-containing protein [Deltaproteobacteria bacterium]